MSLWPLKIGKNLSLSSKIIVLIIVSVPGVSAVTIGVTYSLLSGTFDELGKKEMIEEQAAVTKNVAANIAQASAGVKDANDRVGRTAAVSRSIAQDIIGVNAAVGGIRQCGERVQASATDLSKLAEQLKGLVGRFKI